MRLLFLSLAIIAAMNTYAQNIGIGTKSPRAKLHVAGDLRVDSLAAVGSGIVLFNNEGLLRPLKFTGNKADVLHGDGTFSAAVAADAAWLTTGNAGTNPAVNFIGTTDGQPIRFRINNYWAGQIALSNNSVSFGYLSLMSSTTGSDNIAIGWTALQNTSTGGHNIAMGNSSMRSNTSGQGNIALGATTLHANKSGMDNVAIGITALSSNTTGDDNIGIGVGALALNTTGNKNIAIGHHAMIYNKTGSQLIAVGEYSLYNNTAGANNIAIGERALFFNSSGSFNTAMGFTSLYSNTTGWYNTAFGASALYSSNRSSRNNAFGFEALFYNTVGASNTAIGARALYNNTTGHSHVAVGDSALVNNRGAIGNTAVGELAMSQNTGGNYNASVGYYSLKTNTTGIGNTAVGSGADVSGGGFNNATAIGYNAKVNASNKVRIGNASITKIEGQVPFTTPSDGRYKFNVREDVQGLAFIMKLRPVTYQFDVNRWDGIQPANMNSEMRISYAKATDLRRTGFIAQEVEDAAASTNFEFSGLNRPESIEDRYSLSYESFVVPLVKAVQEQQTIIGKQQAKINVLEEKQKQQDAVIAALLDRLEKLENVKSQQN